MANFDDIKEITKRKEVWRLAVKLEDLWSVYKGKYEDHVEMLIRDVKGDAIQVIINNKDMAAWKPKLTEGKTYNMRNFKVSDNDFGYKMSEHKYKLSFVGGTKVDPLEIPKMPLYAFNLKSLADIKAGKFPPDLLVDAIGAVYDIGKVALATSTNKGKVSFVLRDLSDEILDCTVWDNLAIQFMDYYNNRSDFGPVVMIIKHARVKEAQGEYPLQLTNVWNGTKLLFDDNIPDIKAFRSRLPAELNNVPQLSGISQSTQYLTQASVGSQYNTSDTFMKNARVISLADMKKLKQDTFCVTVVETDHVKVSNQGWCYFVCGTCSKKADGKSPPYICKENHETESPAVRYKMDVEVIDGDTDAQFVFWDNTLDELLGITAAGLLQKMRQEGITDHTEYPDTLEDMMHRTLAFRVKWQYNWKQASVLNCKDCPDLVAKILDGLPNSKIATNFLAQSTKDVAQSSTATKPIVLLPDSEPSETFSGEATDKIESLNDIALSTPLLSASAENDVVVSSEKTPQSNKVVYLEDTSQPSKGSVDSKTDGSTQRSTSKRVVKRSAKYQNPDDPIAAQLSSTKLKVQIKKEK